MSNEQEIEVHHNDGGNTKVRVDDESVVTVEKPKEAAVEKFEDEQDEENKSKMPLLFAAIALLVIVIAIAGNSGSSEKNALENRVCEDGKIEELNDGTLTLFLDGYTGDGSDAEEQERIQTALEESYNEISAGCKDEFERFMYDAKVVSVNTDDETGTTTVELTTQISCYGCPEEKVFASIYPTELQRKLASRQSKLNRVKGASNAIRELQDEEDKEDTEDVATINADEVIEATENRLKSGGSIAGIASAIYQSSNVVSTFYTHSSYVVSYEHYECDGSVKSHKKSKKTAMPSSSSVPSTYPTEMPSAMPSITAAPTKSAKKSSKKTSSPSQSMVPTTYPSSLPSCVPSAMPSLSSSPTETANPTQSMVPTTTKSAKKSRNIFSD